MLLSSINYATLRVFLDGMLCMMVLYALFSYVQQRKAIYWQYALYIMCMVVTFRMDDTDYGQADYKPGGNYYVALIESVAFVLYIRFAVLLINIPENDPFSNRLLRWMTAVLIGGVVLDTGLWLAGTSADLRSTLYTINRYVLAVGALVIVPRILRLHQPVVSYFIGGTFFFVAGCLMALCVNFIPQLFTRQPDQPFTYPVTFMQLGVVAEVLCFTLGMSLRNRQTEKEKIRVQAELIEQLRENGRKQEKLQRIRDDIARDLHDEIGSELSAVSLLSKSAARQVHTQPEHVADVLLTISRTSRRILNSLRDIVWSLNSSPSSYENLSFRMREAAYTLFENAEVQLHFELGDILPEGIVPPDKRRDLFLIYKETLHNVLRHAQARNVWIRVSAHDGQLDLSIQDDGVGLPAAGPKTGSGLQSLQQRADALGGELRISSRPGHGTTVTCLCPIDAPLSVA